LLIPWGLELIENQQTCGRCCFRRVPCNAFSVPARNGWKHPRKVGKREIEAVLADVWTSGKPAISGYGAQGIQGKGSPTGSVNFPFEYCPGGRKGRTQRLSIGKSGDLTPDR
jgi:hypothetical protein